ncbi:hypothetical protein O8C96_04365 [Aliarcobacter butzleri]|uniref:hypothetical protein n=1 Tax=Aliarcobacter butzleri TaxID=28197 RepID=UPI00263C7E83|nr:hypothetical protein [Aliarcobacter butzleri]MDN5044955.1 hypothetical protein [Aliarcobacter butzleri]
MSKNELVSLEKEEKLLELEVKRFELEQRRATALSKSAFFPNALKNDVASAVIIYDLANRMNISVMEVAQSIFIIYNKPSFETKFLVARLNDSGKIKGSLRTVISDDKRSAYCEATCSVTNEILKGMTYTLDIAKAEGLIDKQGSKWKTMPELMLRYRAQSNFINEFFPEIKFGCKTKEEIEDVETLDNSKMSNENKININDINALTLPKQEENKDITVDIVPINSQPPKELLKQELLNRGATDEEAGKWLYNKKDDVLLQYLNDPASIESILIDMKGF